MGPIRTILFPTDFSDCSRYAFQAATALAQEQHAHLVVLHVNQLGEPPATYREVLGALQPREFKDWLWKVLRCFQVSDSGIRIEHRLVEGDPAREILRTAVDTGCDLIVMGTHGRTGLERLIVGSVAEQVLRKSGCPVVTVKLPNPGRAVRMTCVAAGAGR